MTITNSGTVALRIDASAESIDCSPNAMRMNGTTMLTSAITIRCPYWRAERGSGSRVSSTTAHRKIEARTRRPPIIVSGGTVSRAILIQK